MLVPVRYSAVYTFVAGSSVEIRKAAAQQVANVAQTHPAQLPSLIRQVCLVLTLWHSDVVLQKSRVKCTEQVRKHLRHKQWDTRIAASSCLDFMAAHFEHHSTATLSQAAGLQSPTPTVTAEPGKASTGGMILQNFNILQVLGQGTILVASEGQVMSLCCSYQSGHERVQREHA